MGTNYQVDVRSEQLAILKLEERGLKKMATALLTNRKSQTAKLGAVAAVGALLLTAQAASHDFAGKVELNQQTVKAMSVAFKQAHLHTNNIEAMLKQNESTDLITEEMKKLFALVGSEHERLEAVAKERHARLIQPVETPKAGGTGGKERPEVWLNRQLIGVSSFLAS